MKLSSYCFGRVRSLSAVFGLALLGSIGAKAAVVNVTGNLGSQTFSGPIHLAVNTSNTTSFTKTLAGLGTITGDVFTKNTGGTQFDMRITNLQFISFNQSMTQVVVGLIVVQNYATPAAVPSFTASHSMAGNWSGQCAVNVACTQDYLGTNVILPSLTSIQDQNFPTTAFGDGPYTATVTPVAGPVYHIRTDMTLIINGPGSINLPGSYDASAIGVPAPGSMLPLAACTIFARRRRS